MKNRSNTIIELTVLLALCIGVTLVISRNYEKRAAEEALWDTPLVADDQAPTWNLDTDLDALAEENLVAPVREKYGVMNNPKEAMSRCASGVGYVMNGTENVTDEEGFYNGTVYINVGCELSAQYEFRMDTTATTFEIKDTDGNYVSVEEWAKAE